MSHIWTRINSSDGVRLFLKEDFGVNRVGYRLDQAVSEIHRCLPLRYRGGGIGGGTTPTHHSSLVKLAIRLGCASSLGADTARTCFNRPCSYKIAGSVIHPGEGEERILFVSGRVQSPKVGFRQNLTDTHKAQGRPATGQSHLESGESVIPAKAGI